MKPRKSSLIIPLIIIEVLSLATIWSTAPELFVSQLSFAIAGWIFIYLILLTDIRLLQSLSPFLYFFTIILLILTHFIGENIRGSIRWIDLGFFNLQTSEIAKPLLAFVFADLVNRFPPKTWRNIGIILGISILPIFLVFRQPDLGSALTLAFVPIALIFLNGGWKKMLILGVIGAILLIPLESYLLKPYQRQRISTFLNPYADPQGAGYNVIQATIAIGSGGPLGKGIRLGTQSHLNFLPERHTDFIFASYSEEFGFFGSVLLLFTFFSLFAALLKIIRYLRNKTDSLLVGAVLLTLIFQTVVNIGMNLGVMPVTGITLPFFSYGGSSLLSFSILIGIALRLLDLARPFEL